MRPLRPSAILLICLKDVFILEGERQSRERGRGRGRKSHQAASRLSGEPDTELYLTTLRSRPELKSGVRRSTSRATQCPYIIISEVVCLCFDLKVSHPLSQHHSSSTLLPPRNLPHRLCRGRGWCPWRGLARGNPRCSLVPFSLPS